MFPFWCFYTHIVIFNLVAAHTRLDTEKPYDVVKKNIGKEGDGSGKTSGIRHMNQTESVSYENGDDIPENQVYEYNEEATEATDQSYESQSRPESQDQSGNYESYEGVGPPPYYSANSDQEDLKSRALESGDTFTPIEMLPISIKLLQKVDNPGEGTGIVSSAKTPEELSDKLFAAYFLTSRRIVFLDDKDLSGLDALQALALEGDAVEFKMGEDSITEAPYKMINLRGQLVGISERPEKCHYKLISKKVDGSGNSNLRRDGPMLKLEKKLRPNRHLVINFHRARKSNKRNKIKMRTGTGHHPGNKENKYEDKDTEKGAEETAEKRTKKGAKKGIKRKIPRHRIKKTHGKVRKSKSRQKLNQRQKNGGVKKRKNTKGKHKLKKMEKPRHSEHKRHHLRNKINREGAPLTTTRKPACKWTYLCKNPGDLDSCRLHTSCIDESNTKTKIDDIYMDHNEDEHSEKVKQFRKMLGITLIDEAVEKIIEQHILLIKPENIGGKEKIETLEQYFNNIIKYQHDHTTTPIPTEAAHMLNVKISNTTPKMSSSENEDASDDDLDMDLRAQKQEKPKETVNASQPNGRKILALPTISTTKTRRK